MFGLSLATLSVVVVTAFLTGILHGATGMAGGVVMAAILAHVVGIKIAVPIMTCALVFSHASRVAMYRRDTDWAIAARVLSFGLPTIVLGAWIFSRLAPEIIALVFAVFLVSSFPIRSWARKRQIRTGPRLLAGASAVWGMLAGNVIGPGFFLAPFLLGTGMNRMTFVGTLATITLVMNLVKLTVFGVTDLMNPALFALGVLIGLVTIPGNWVGRNILKKLSDGDHRLLIDLLTIAMIVNFIYLAII